MSKARDLANAGTALGAVDATELGYLDGVTSAVQTQINSKEATLPSQTGNSGKYLTTNGTDKSWGTVSQYALPSQTGNSGKYLTTNGTAESWGTVATNPVWTTRGITGQQVNSIATNGSTIFVAVGDAGLLYSSTDSGVTWTSRTSGFGASDITCVAFGNGIFVAVGNSGKITTSTDGITWTARTAGVSTNALLSVNYVNSVFIAVGDGANGGTGGITTSTDGITWTKRTTPASTTGTLLSVAYGNGYYVAVGQFVTTAGVYSTNLSTWTALGVSLSQTCGFVTYQNSTFMAFSNNESGDMYTIGSTPTGAWTGISTGAPLTTAINQSLHQAIRIYNSKMYWINPGTALGTMGLSGITVSGTTYTVGSNFGLNVYYNNIPVPTYQRSASSFTRPTAMEITSSGVICISFGLGRIATAQL